MTVLRVILAAWLLATAAVHAQFAGRKFVIDPGHGGVDPGAVGIDGGAYPNEEDFVLDVAQRLKTRLEGAGAEVILTRSTDATVSLTARRDLANAEDPDAFLSIHCNSFTNATAHGTETFWWESGNTADQTLATHVQSRMMDAFGLTNRGVKQGNFTVITGIPPSSLAEMMFISNQAEFNPGQTAAFTVAATGTGLTYRWRRNGVNLSNSGAISGATSPTLTVTGAQLANTGFYTVAVTSGSSTSISDEAQLVIAATPTAAGTGSGLRGTYYDNPDFTALRRARLDATVNFNWAAGSPSSTMQPDTFSARWTGQISPRYSQTYSFHVRSDDGVRLWVNNVLLIDKWVAQGATEWSGTLAMVAGQKYDIRLEYFDGTGNALAELRWSSPSQIKQIVPTTQLFRPPPVIVAVPPTTVLQGEALNLAIATSSFDPLLSSQPWADFEDETDGATDLVLFRKPEFSGTTSANVDLTKARSTTVRAAFPAGNSSARALHVEWSWATGAVNPWIRLTTLLASTLPNPVIDFRKTLRFDVWSEHTLRFGLGLRETNSTGAIGSDGGSAGAIEFVGVNAMNGTSPVPVRTVAPDSWTTLEFDLPTEPTRAFTGNGLLESTTGLGVLEHLCIAAGSASIDHDVYLDNFVVVEKNQLTYSLLAGPNGATIDPNTGAISWTPTAAQVGINHPFTVQVSDGGLPAASATVSFSIPAAPYPEVVATAQSGPNFTFTWKAAPGAKYDIETAIHPAGPWTVVTEITAATATGSYSTVIVGTQKYYRARLK
jgi:hypothetical protein